MVKWRKGVSSFIGPVKSSEDSAYFNGNSCLVASVSTTKSSSSVGIWVGTLGPSSDKDFKRMWTVLMGSAFRKIGVMKGCTPEPGALVNVAD